jgi:hypothetical protein
MEKDRERKRGGRRRSRILRSKGSSGKRNGILQSPDKSKA